MKTFLFRLGLTLILLSVAGIAEYLLLVGPSLEHLSAKVDQGTGVLLPRAYLAFAGGMPVAPRFESIIAVRILESYFLAILAGLGLIQLAQGGGPTKKR